MRPEPWPGKPPQEGRRLAKRPPNVQQGKRVFPVPWAIHQTIEKPRESGRLWCVRPARAWRSEPLRTTAVAAAVPIMVAVHAALHPAVAPAALGAKPAMVGQDGQAALLTIIERLVERIGGIRDLLHRARGSGHGVGALAQARHRIIALLLIVAHLLHPRIGAIDPQFREI